MSMRPLPAAPISNSTARVVQAAFPDGCLAIRVGDELGVIFDNAELTEVFARRGGPSVPPEMLALTLLANLTCPYAD